MSFASSFGPTPGKPKDFDGLEAFDKTEAAGDYVPVPGYPFTAPSNSSRLS